MSKKTYVQDPETGKFVEKHTRHYRGHVVGHGFDPVYCPRTGERISSSKQMKELQQHTGLTNSLASLNEQTKREQGRREMKTTPVTRAEISDAFDRVASSGFHRREQYE